jgi:protein-S-isoprenylcysteine O-methyltransferase Ste14
MLAIAGAVIATAFLGLGKSLTPLPHPRDGATLNTEGVYALMRHPIYAAIVLSVVGWSAWLLSFWGLVCAVLVAIFFDRKAASEERRLRARYVEYDAYARRVRRFIPWLY